MNEEKIDSKQLAERMIQVTHLFAHAVKSRLPPQEMCIAPNQMHIMKMASHMPMTMSELARAHHVSTPTMSSAIDKLVKKGFMKRERSKEDRRIVHASVTHEGELVMSEMFAKFIHEVSRILEPLASEDKVLVMKGFDVLDRAISDVLETS